MNETFLFRGKRLDCGWWTEGYLTKRFNPNTNKIIVCIEFQKQDYNYMLYNEVDPKTVGQCTGIRDKNKKLIFEGDIVKVVWDSDPAYNLPDNEEAEICFIKDIRRIPKIKGSSIKYCEVIGNIHDTPELLEGI